MNYILLVLERIISVQLPVQLISTEYLYIDFTYYCFLMIVDFIFVF